MVFAALSDSAVRIAFWIGAISSILIIVMLLEIFWMRMVLLAQKFRRQRFISRWQPILIKSISGEQPHLPTLHPKELSDLLLLWIRLQKTVRGDASERLNRLLANMSVEQDILEILKNGKLDDRLIAITVSGFLGLRTAWSDLTTLIQDQQPAISITSARALLRIDEEQATPYVIPAIIKRRDWTVDRTAVMLKEASPKFVHAFVDAVEQAEIEHQPYLLRLMRILDVLQLDKPIPFIRDVLENSTDPELVTSALKLVRGAEDLDLVRNRIEDTNWSVQVQIATVLGRLGSREDVPRLVSLLHSKAWWVRYRAAKSLIQLPFVTLQEIQTLRDSLNDLFARDILSQIMAEQVET